VPANWWPGVLLPLSMPAACLMKYEEGGVFILHVNVLSWYAVRTTGMGTSSLMWAVLALKSLQKSMILRPAWPRAGPTGGDGFAWPALMSSLMVEAMGLFADIVMGRLSLACEFFFN